HSESPRLCLQMLEILLIAFVSRQNRYTSGTHARFGDDLRAHRSDSRGRWPDECQPGLRASVGKLSVLREKSVTGMDGLCAAGASGIEQPAYVQVALARSSGTDVHRFIGFPDVTRGSVGVGEHRDSPYAEALYRAEYATSNLP